MEHFFYILALAYSAALLVVGQTFMVQASVFIALSTQYPHNRVHPVDDWNNIFQRDMAVLGRLRLGLMMFIGVLFVMFIYSIWSTQNYPQALVAITSALVFVILDRGVRRVLRFAKRCPF